MELFPEQPLSVLADVGGRRLGSLTLTGCRWVCGMVLGEDRNWSCNRKARKPCHYTQTHTPLSVNRALFQQEVPVTHPYTLVYRGMFDVFVG